MATQFAFIGYGPTLENHDSQWPLLPFGMRNADDCSLCNRRMCNKYVLDVDGTDPLSARLDHIFQSVCDLYIAVGIDCCDITRAEPAILRPLRAFFRSLVVVSDDIWSSDFHFAGCAPIPRYFAGIIDCSDINEWRWSSLFRTELVPIIFTRELHLQMRLAYCGDWG